MMSSLECFFVNLPSEFSQALYLSLPKLVFLSITIGLKGESINGDA